MVERSRDASRAAGMCPHGNFPSSCASCAAERKREDAPSVESGSELTRERLKDMATLGIEVKTDLAPMLHAVNEKLGASMAHRESGFHVTVIGPTEAKLLGDLSDEQLSELRRISEAIARGEGITVSGIGVIDGTTANVPEKDRSKRTSFLAIEAPTLDEFRRSLGLPKKDLHVTLGFEGGDIHMARTGEKDKKGKDVLAPIEKKADPAFHDIVAAATIEFAGLKGKEKDKRQEAPADPEKESKKRLQGALAKAGLGGKDLIALGVRPGPDMGKVVAAIERSVKEGVPFEAAIPPDAKAAIEERIANARKEFE